MNPAPAYQHYPKDWLAMTGRLTLEQQGALKLLLDHQWMEGALPDDSVILARIIGLSPEDFASRIWPFISRHFFTKKSGLLNPEMEKQRRVQVAFRREQSRKGIRSGQLRREQRLNSGSSPVRTESQPEGNSASASPSPKTKTTASANGNGKHKATWITPYLEAHRSVLGEPALGRMLEAVKPAHDALGADGALKAFKLWLATPETKFGGVSNFCTNWRLYEPIPLTLPNGDLNPKAEAQMSRMGLQL